ncbi:hypothetical protein F4779DRAFT_572837 [Xylariaceae sp. FL0662B]|nr:hypothetical protein F4779DRAFT_572837 [Xylariaceae sp. FL0662B]
MEFWRIRRNGLRYQGHIAVVPSVNLEYSNEAAGKIKELKGYTSKWTAREDEQAAKIEWVGKPPNMVQCSE